ncbi:SPFH domain-containing protein [Streptomyces sp. NPDC088097]|uniref:SPFH domain-containing protein n=1 Tax=Streptomyces sp. NPDC088097 TaxID=3365823 RepID=UPI00380A02A9
MYPTRTTFTTGTFHLRPSPARPEVAPRPADPSPRAAIEPFAYAEQAPYGERAPARAGSADARPAPPAAADPAGSAYGADPAAAAAAYGAAPASTAYADARSEPVAAWVGGHAEPAPALLVRAEPHPRAPYADPAPTGYGHGESEFAARPRAAHADPVPAWAGPAERQPVTVAAEAVPAGIPYAGGRSEPAAPWPGSAGPETGARPRAAEPVPHPQTAEPVAARFGFGESEFAGRPRTPYADPPAGPAPVPAAVGAQAPAGFAEASAEPPARAAAEPVPAGFGYAGADFEARPAHTTTPSDPGPAWAGPDGPGFGEPTPSGTARGAHPEQEPRIPVPTGHAEPEVPAQAAPYPEPAPRPGRWVDAEVPAARVRAEPEPAVHPRQDGPWPAPPAPPAAAIAASGIPGPGVADLVARAVTRGMRDTAQEDDTQDIPLLAPPLRGAAVTEVPVHLPFLGRPEHRPEPRIEPRPEPRPHPAPRTDAPIRTAPRPKAPAGRRVPQGDDRLREHCGPVLPGWVAVAVGGLALAGCATVLWRAGVVPPVVVEAFGVPPRPYQGLRAGHWPPLAFLGIVALLALGGLGRARAGHAWVLTLFGRYRGTVRRTGLTWVSPLLLRRRVDVRLRHWRSEPMAAVDSGGLALRVVVQVVWQVKDTARATLAVEDHVEYLAEQVESAMARVLSQLPADAFHEDAPTLRDAEAVGDALTRMLAAETEAVGVEVFSAQPIRIEYAPEVAEAMRRRRVAAIDARHRDTVLTSVVDAVDDTVHRLTSRGIVELDDYERKALVKDLTVAFYTGRGEQ